MYNKCCIEHCGTKRKDVKMHPFPIIEIKLKKWLLSINSNYLRTLSSQKLHKLCVCQKHFEKKFISKKNRLKLDAYPSLFSAFEITSGIPTTVDEDVYQNRDHIYSLKRKHDDHTYASLPDTSLAVPLLSEKPTTHDEVSSICDTEHNGNVTAQSLSMPSTSRMPRYTDDAISIISGTANEENELSNIGSSPIAEPRPPYYDAILTPYLVSLSTLRTQAHCCGWREIGVAESCADAGDSGPVEEPRDDGTDICDDDDDNSDTLVESNICRVCLALDVKMYDLKDIELREMFQNITGIVVPENNHSMLERLCWECAGRLKAAAAFRNKALLSDALLQGLANTGEQIRKNDVTLIKENQDYLKSAGTLSIVEVFHTVQIDAEYESVPSISENNDTDIVQNTVRKDSIELKQSIIKENNDQMDVEDELMIGAPIKIVIEYDPVRPNTGEINRNIVLETNPTLSNNIPLKENTSNSAYSSPPSGCSRVETKDPIVGYLTPSATSENKVKKTVVRIPKRDSISKIISKKSKAIINQDQTLKGAAKLKKKFFKVYGNSKKTLNQKLVKKTQVMTNTSTDEEYTDVEYLNFENDEF